MEGGAAAGFVPLLRSAGGRGGVGDESAVPGDLQSSGRNPRGDVPDHGEQPVESATAGAAAGPNPEAMPGGVPGYRGAGAAGGGGAAWGRGGGRAGCGGGGAWGTRPVCARCGAGSPPPLSVLPPTL